MAKRSHYILSKSCILPFNFLPPPLPPKSVFNSFFYKYLSFNPKLEKLGFVMASSDYEIITDPWDPKCVSACCMYFPGQEPEDTELLLEKIRGKLDERIHNHTLAEEYRIINEQIVKSQGFDVDFSKLRYLFDFQPAFLDDCDSDTGRDFFRKLSAEAIEIYNEREVMINSLVSVCQKVVSFFIWFLFVF